MSRRGSRNGPGESVRAEEFVVIVNVVTGGVGVVYTASASVMLAALALGGFVVVGLVVLLRHRGHER